MAYTRVVLCSLKRKATVI